MWGVWGGYAGETQLARDRTQSLVVTWWVRERGRGRALFLALHFSGALVTPSPFSACILAGRKMGSQQGWEKYPASQGCSQPLSPVSMSQKRRLRLSKDGSCLACAGVTVRPRSLSMSLVGTSHTTIPLVPTQASSWLMEG